MKLIWTFNTNIPSMYEAPWQKDILLSFYIASIKSAKKIGYNTIIYTNESLAKTFELIADDIIIVEEYEQSELFDCFKIKVLEERTDDFYLVDGDILFNSPLPIFDVDVTFDAVETNFIEESYITPIKNSIELGIISEIPFLEHERLKTVFNCGVLRINDPNLKNEYIKYWKIYNRFVKVHNISTKENTGVAAQYILTNLVKIIGNSYQPISDLLGRQNEYYRHYTGGEKYKTKVIFTESKRLH